jgi:hypothetical protein
MAVHYFHCTDGIDIVLDRAGQNIRSKRELQFKAWRAAERIMGAVAGDFDWSDWVVSVQDRKGMMVDVIAFPDRARRAA